MTSVGRDETPTLAKRFYFLEDPADSDKWKHKGQEHNYKTDTYYVKARADVTLKGF